MRITSVKYRANAEVRPYHHEHCEVEVEVAPNDDADDAFEFAKDMARSFLGIDVTEAQVEEAKQVLAKAEKAFGRKNS